MPAVSVSDSKSQFMAVPQSPPISPSARTETTSVASVSVITTTVTTVTATTVSSEPVMSAVTSTVNSTLVTSSSVTSSSIVCCTVTSVPSNTTITSQAPLPTYISRKYSYRMWNALKSHIMRERKRKKQQKEEEDEQERILREIRAREQQHVMSLEETKEQIISLENQMLDLKEEKHKLFIILKRVLNDDEYKRNQLARENNELLNQSMPKSTTPSSVYLQSNPQQQLIQGAQHSLQITRTIGSTPIINSTTNFRAMQLKRSHSISPPNIQAHSTVPTVAVTSVPGVVPLTLYHPSVSYNYKPPNVSYGDERRGHEQMNRSVLWNKNAHLQQQTQHYGNTAATPTGYYLQAVHHPDAVFYAPGASSSQAQPVTPPLDSATFIIRSSSATPLRDSITTSNTTSIPSNVTYRSQNYGSGSQVQILPNQSRSQPYQ